MRRIVAVILSGVLVSACDRGAVSFPVTKQGQSAVDPSVEIIRLDATNISSFSVPANGPSESTISANRGWTYLIGTGDILNVIVFDHPELNMPSGPERSPAEAGFHVQADGRFFYPYIGQVEAAGHTPEEIRSDVSTRLAEFIPDPQVEVRIVAFNSQSVVVAGEVGTPNRQALTSVPLALIEAVNGAGGLNETADGAQVTIQRGGKVYRVDLDGFLFAGIQRNNPVLRAGDVITVPRQTASEVYVLGEVLRPGPIDLAKEAVTLTQAIARQGGMDETRGDARGVFVFRTRGAAITVFQLETGSPAGLLLGTRFLLQPQDVVYVTRSPLQRWNDTISGLLPTVRAVTVSNGIGL